MFVTPCASGTKCLLGRGEAVRRDRVHAVRRQELGNRVEVGRRDTDRATALVAVGDDPRERVGPAENAAYLVEVPGHDRLAGPRARVSPPVVARHGVDADPETQLRPEGPQQREVSRPLRAEPEVFADEHDPRPKRSHDQVPREALGLPRCERGVEPPDVHALDSQGRHELGPSLEGRQSLRSAPADDSRGVGVEREHARGEAARSRMSDGLTEHGLMPEVDPVEVADDEHATGAPRAIRRGSRRRRRSAGPRSSRPKN